jgi:hypothetical protein
MRSEQSFIRVENADVLASTGKTVVAIAVARVDPHVQTCYRPDRRCKAVVIARAVVAIWVPEVERVPASVLAYKTRPSAIIGIAG